MTSKTSNYAVQSDPKLNPQFRRRWAELERNAKDPAHISFADKQRLALGAAHLYELGPDAVAEFLRKVGIKSGGMAVILKGLDEYRGQALPETASVASRNHHTAQALFLTPTGGVQ